MLTEIKKKSAGVAGSIVIIIVAALVALSGIQYYVSKTGDNKAVASVNGTNILQHNFDRSYKIAKFYYKNNKIDLESQQLLHLQQQVLGNLVSNALKQDYANKQGIYVPDYLRDSYVTKQQHFYESGKFSVDKYNFLVKNTYGSEELFLASVVSDLKMSQLLAGIVDTTYVLPYEIDDITSLLQMQRDIKYLRLSVKDLDVVQPTNAELLTYYNEHPSEFYTASKVKLDYILIDKQQVAKKLQPTTQQLQNFYDANKYNYNRPASFSVKNYNISALSAAKLSEFQIQQLQQLTSVQELNRFLANNKDSISYTVSKESDLLPKNFIKQQYHIMATNMSVGSVYLYSLADDTYKIIELASYKDDNMPSLAKIKARVLADWRNEQVELQYASLVEQFTELAYTMDNLVDIASETGYRVASSAYFTKDHGVDFISNFATVRDIAFSEEIISSAVNSDLIKLSAEQAVILHINKHIAEQQQSFSKVKDIIAAKLFKQKQQDYLAHEAENILATLRSSKSIPEELNSKWQYLKNIKSQGVVARLAMEIRDNIFDMPQPTANLHSYANIKLADNDVLIVELLKVHPAIIDTLVKSDVYDKYSDYYNGWALTSLEQYLYKHANIEYFN